MGLAFEAAQSALLDALQADMMSAWGLTKVHRDAPELVKSAGNLPVAYLFVTDARPDGDRSLQPCNVAAAHTVTLALRFAKPATSLLEAKRAKAEAMRTLVGAARLYNGVPYRWDGDEYLHPDPEEVEKEASNSAFATVRLFFTFWVQAS